MYLKKKNLAMVSAYGNCASAVHAGQALVTEVGMYREQLAGDEGAERVAFSMLISGSAVPMRMGNVPAGLVWIFAIVISSGQSAMTAKNSVSANPQSRIAPLCQ